MSRARLTLRPQELGGVEVRLHSTAQGVSASVRADVEATAATLQTAVAELRRSLEEAGVTVARLDVTWTGHGAREGGQGRQAEERSSGRRAGRDFDLEADAAVEAVPVTIASSSHRDAGALVDVSA